MDELIQKIYSVLLPIIDNEKLILILAVGGYGRNQLAPFSDIDLLFGYDQTLTKDKVKKIVEFFLYPLWDLGIKVGYAVRNFKEIISFSKRDAIIKTTMLDARLIVGSEKVFNHIMNKYTEEFSRKSIIFLKEKINERKENIKKIGFDYFKNEPNIKESEGSIRDINLIFWCLKILRISNQKKIKNFDSFLTTLEKKKINKALNNLLTLRCYMHYECKKQNDKLTFDLQKKVSQKLFSFKDKSNLNQSVESLMKNYFKQIKIIKNLSKIIPEVIIEECRKESKKKLIFTEQAQKNLMKRIYNGEENYYFLREISNNLKKITKKNLNSESNIMFFKKILFSNSNKAMEVLNESDLLNKMIPPFKKIDDLTQFDRFHALSVGQHTLKALYTLKNLNFSYVSQNYKYVKNILKKKFDKKPLYFSVLLHDIGKGQGGKHGHKGAILSHKIVLELKESNDVAKETAWLVQNHLLLSEFAFKKDIEDFSVIKKISSKIKTLHRLYSLFILTVSDISSVDHGIWNSWKASLLEKLVRKIELEIKKPFHNINLNTKIEQIKNNVLESSKIVSQKKLTNFSKITYPNYWLLQDPKVIKFQIENFFCKKIDNQRFDFHIKKNEKQKLLEIIIVTSDRPSLFLDLISIFFFEDHSILEARIFTLADNTVIDTFKTSFKYVEKMTDEDFARKISSLKIRLRDLKKNKALTLKQKFFLVPKLITKKININFDNISSSTYTVLEVITNDRPGLLFDISKVLLKHKLVISMAKISTNGDFVEDSFHIRNEFGLKIDKDDSMKSIKKEIHFALEKGLNNAS
jgi:[protein-PII] uridylyltransferase